MHRLPSITSPFQNLSHFVHFKTIIYQQVWPCFPLLTINFAYQYFNVILFLSHFLLMGRLCICVLDRLVWSNNKRTEPGRDASLLQTDTSSKSCESANHAEVSSF